MNTAVLFIRIFFLLFSVLFTTTYMTTVWGGFTLTNIAVGAFSGLAFSLLLIGIDSLFKTFNLRAFNIAILGLFTGYLMGQALVTIIQTAIDFGNLPISPATVSIVKIAVFLFAAYLGMVMTARASEELYMSIPFVRFKPTAQKKKEILIDHSVLVDSRMLDLAASGLLDNQVLLPRFILKDLYTMLESHDEESKSKARKSLDLIKKLEAIPSLDLKYIDTDFPEIKESLNKLVRLARLQDAYVLTADISRVQQSSIEGVRFINIHMLGLKPITHAGEYINIKIQRYGKEPRQGVGYLDDGTMVVVNGGAEFIGETIKVQVLSIKPTSSGRMIFCNATDENLFNEQEAAEALASLNHSSMDQSNLDQTHKSYFAL
jgi:uncharacterized protein YacL